MSLDQTIPIGMTETRDDIDAADWLKEAAKAGPLGSRLVRAMRRQGLVARRTGRDAGRFVLDALPVETVESARIDAGTKTAVGKTMKAMLVAALILAMFQSHGLQVLTRDLPGNAFTDRLVRMADGWNEMMEAAGIAALSQSVRDAVQAVHDYGTGEEDEDA